MVKTVPHKKQQVLPIAVPESCLLLKIGGSIAENPAALEEIATELKTLALPTVMVHGGGTEVDHWCETLKIPTSKIDGVRVTDSSTLDVATAVLAGLVNKRVVARLRGAGLDAIGLSLLDGGICELRPHPDHEQLGNVGVVREVRDQWIKSLLTQGFTPVLATIGCHEGKLLNVNADDVAAAIAAALPTTTLISLSDVRGVILNGKLVPHLSLDELEEVLTNPTVSGGMLAKLNSIKAAITQGLGSAFITTWSGPGTIQTILAGEQLGTSLTAHSPSAPENIAHQGVSS